jgi:hypothetical protein
MSVPNKLRACALVKRFAKETFCLREKKAAGIAA